jgi:putative tricarboxylic transport membrane protein
MHLVAALVGILGIAHWIAAWRQRAKLAASGAVRTLLHGNHAALAWVLGSLIGLIAILQFGGGFIAGSTWLFAGTARAFGERLSIKSFAIGIVLASLVYAFFTKALSLSLPAGPIERLLFG